MSRARNDQPQDHRTELLQAFRVDGDDIESNRMGQLGARQRRRLVRSGYLNLAGATAMAVALGGIVLAIAERPLKPVQVILAGILVVALLILGIVQLTKANAAAADGRIDVHAGPVYVRMRGRAGWYLTVGDQSFKLPVQFWHVQDEAPYRVYVAPKAGRIMAMEPDGWG